MNPNVKNKRHALLGALFIAAQERGIDEQQLRDEIAPGLIGRRLSAASEKQISAVLAHIKGPRSGARVQGPGSSEKKYASTLQGLRDEIKDLAISRWSIDGWEQPLNNFCRRFGIQRWQWLDVPHGRAVKAAILRLQLPDTGTENRQGDKVKEHPLDPGPWTLDPGVKA